MKQITTQKFVSKCSRGSLYVENDMPLGELHDFLMLMKGMMVERMLTVHREELEASEIAKAEPEHCEAC